MKKICVLVLFLLSGCNENARTRNFGGESKVDLPPGEKLVNVTWKETDLWVLTRQMRDGEPAETFFFSEKSKWGVFQGRVTIREFKR